MLIHEAVGTLQKGFDLFLLRVVADDNTHAERQGIAARWGIPLAFAESFFNSSSDLSFVGLRNEDGEFIATKARQNVRLAKTFA